ncbi:hypothetical protein [Leptolyngbya sp. 7M]|uniref:hypothetical protein n=1 Tax=Leptolyngbya sp. 7M TaxID=2812896 RepID=UPI001B8BAF7F|nr:hypothetical protein [Leptolyngbya sp. 7M]QYO65283.1 hypothetical protein JVX88_00415 [Leptolyngbya sp. 7M]
MPFTEQLLRDEFVRLLDDIRVEISNKEVAVRSIQLLLPDTHALANIQRFLFCAADDRVPYTEIADRFVFERENPLPDSRPKRSLYFQRFRRPFMYKPYGRGRSSVDEKILVFDCGELDQSRNPIVEVSEEDERELSKDNRLDEFWEAWCGELAERSFGDSTLWTYIMIREDSGLPAISSAFVVFDGVIRHGCCSDDTNFERLSVISKRLQDTLIRLVGKLYLLALERQATRAAISQVMARNMSHNIGSHVLSKFKAPEHIFTNSSDFKYAAEPAGCKGPEKTASKSGKEGSTGDGEAEKKDEPTMSNQYCGLVFGKDKNQYLSIPTDEKDNESQIAYFNDYLKTRMDFLADIATADPVIESPMFFVSEIMKGFDKNRILLNRISGVSDSQLRFRIEVLRDGGAFKSDLSNDIQLSMTNDVLGAQAFYIIIENIIRNICKHSNPSLEDKGSIRLTINVSDSKDHPAFYEVSIYDNLPKVYDPSKPDGDEMGKLLRDRNQAFTGSILDKRDNTVRPTNLGTIEMDVCAAYLRCLPIDTVENDDYELEFCGKKDEAGKESHTHGDNDEQLHAPGEVKTIERATKKPDSPFLMYAFKHPINQEANKYSLGYKFYIPKPKEVLVIDDKGHFTIEGTSSEDFSSHGLLRISSQDLKRELEAGTIYKHQFIYLHNVDNQVVIDGLLKLYFASLPKRVISRIEDPDKLDLKSFMDRLWESHLFGGLLPDGKSVMLIRDSEDENLVLMSEGGAHTLQ